MACKREMILIAMIAVFAGSFVAGWVAGQANQKPGDEVKFPMIVAEDYGCSGGSCFLVVSNAGSENTSCSRVSLYGDSEFIGTLDEFTDIYGSKCEKISPGMFQVLSVPDMCSKYDRISLVTEIPGLLDRRLTGYFRFNMLCE